ncbi:MAG: hypothetical protein KDA91_13150 [Planctomycetaceae bacterium]|nr:hypothetical protein [Planctomycetaceae bacterium]
MKTSNFGLVKVFSFALVATVCQLAVGQTTDTQTFTVTVPSALSIVAPADRQLNHDTTNNNQVFVPGADVANHWAVMCNSGAGATVNLTTSTPFTHTTNSNFKRDARLDLAISSSDNDGTGSAVWTVSTATDTTDYAGADADASVQATSAAPGKATLGLTVTFITDTYSTLLQGDYEIDVVGTIAAN